MSLEERIQDTLRWFALQQTPLTFFELERFLVRDLTEVESLQGDGHELEQVSRTVGDMVSSAALLQTLDRLISQGTVCFAKGFYTLSKYQDLPARRLQAYQYGLKREQRLRSFAWLLRYLPFVDGVAVAGSQALGDQKSGSDIDLFIVTSPGWLWLPRTLVTAVFQVFGVRRHGQKIANRFCLNHYVGGAKKIGVYRNLYTATEYMKLRTLSGPAAIANFQEVNLSWLKSFYPKSEPVGLVAGFPTKSKAILEKCLNNSFGKWLESIFMKIQKSRIRTEERYIVVEADELSFHPSSKQEGLLAEFFETQKQDNGEVVELVA